MFVSFYAELRFKILIFYLLVHIIQINSLSYGENFVMQRDSDVHDPILSYNSVSTLQFLIFFPRFTNITVTNFLLTNQSMPLPFGS